MGQQERLGSLSVFREVGIGLHFVNLLGMPLAVRGDKEQPLVCVERLAERAVGHMRAQIWRVLHELDGLFAAGEEVFERLIRCPAAW